MQNRTRRVLGMTIPQLIILACLGLIALGAIGVGARLVLGNSTPLDSALPVSTTQELQSTFIPSPTWTPFPSSTPVLPTPTFTATTYESLIPKDWVQYKYAKVEMWMPADFVKKSSKDFLIFAESKQVDDNGYKVNVSLTKDTTALNDLDDYIQVGIQNFTPDTTFLEKRNFEIGTYEARRLKLEVVLENIPMENATYIIRDGETIWIVSAISHYDEFRDWLTIFDKIARTFRISP